MSSDALGHHAARSDVLAGLERGALPHALLVCGEDGIGKTSFAGWLVRTAWCPDVGATGACGVCATCRKVDSGNHPDLIVVRRGGAEGDEPGGGRASRHEITVSQVRELIVAGLGFRPVEAPGKAVVVLGADDMNDEAQNALLKSLEEPPSGSRLVLVATREDRLLDTIRSRCQTLRLAPLSDDELEAARPEVDPAWRALCRGRPGLLPALAALDVPALLSAFDAVLAGRVPGSAFAARVAEVLAGVGARWKDLHGEGDDDEDRPAGPFAAARTAPDERGAAALALDLLHARLRDHALAEAGSPTPAATWGMVPRPEGGGGPDGPGRPWDALERALLEATEDIRRHVPAPVVWTALGLSLTIGVGAEPGR